MSLSRTSLMEVVKRQYLFKLKSFIQVFMTLVVLQLLAMLFSFNGVGMMGSSNGSVEMDIQYYSADIVVVFTMLWAFITAILITTKAYRNDDFAFVTNRLSSNLIQYAVFAYSKYPWRDISDSVFVLNESDDVFIGPTIY